MVIDRETSTILCRKREVSYRWEMLGRFFVLIVMEGSCLEYLSLRELDRILNRSAKSETQYRCLIKRL